MFQKGSSSASEMVFWTDLDEDVVSSCSEAVCWIESLHQSRMGNKKVWRTGLKTYLEQYDFTLILFPKEFTCFYGFPDYSETIAV